MKKHLAALVLLAATLTACGSSDNGSGQSAGPATTTVTVAPSESAATPNSAAPSSSKSTAASATQAGVTDFQQYMYEQMLKNPSVGDTIDMKGTPTTTCIYGDGYGLHLVTAGPNTSCDFAKAVVDVQTQGLNATEDNIRDSLRPSVEATSPATGKSYTMSCSNDADNLITCTGGNNASVYMY